MKTTLPLALLISACAGSQVAPSTAVPTTTVVLASEAEWEQLNPARGDASPMAATLWGDRNGKGPTGFLFRPVDGFESPPHAHNVSYRGVVIRGLVHNDDPEAEEVWMPTGSYWTQPKGGVHITSARGTDILAYIEIDEGPYLVLPVDEAFDVDEVPLNVDASKIAWSPQPGTETAVAQLWGDPLDDEPSGALIRLPAGFVGALRSHGASLRAVVIEGRPTYRASDDARRQTLEPGSYFSSFGRATHQVSTDAGEGAVVYIRAEGAVDVSSLQDEP
ncbi:MAG: DUF4437 domain-containing protein [Myxococcota bacterium]